MMDVKMGQVPDWSAYSLKHEEEEIPIEACYHPLLLPSTLFIKQEVKIEEAAWSVGGAACPKASEINLKAEAAWEVLEQKPQLVISDSLISMGPWAWKQQSEGQELMCRRCGQVVAACTIADVREHMLHCHSSIPYFNVEQRHCYLDAPKEGLLFPKEADDKPLLCTLTLSDSTYNAGHSHGNSAPAEIEVSIDADEQPANSKHIQARRSALQHCGTMKNGKIPTKSPRQPKEKGKRNPRSSIAQTYPSYQGQGIKYTPINLAPAEIRVFTDGSFPKGFILRLYSRGKTEPRKNQKRKGLSVRVKRTAEKKRKLDSLMVS